MKRWIVIVAAVVVAGAATAYVTTRREAAGPSYRFVAVERGSIDAVVTATGTLSAVTTVQVGTQVSGLISKLYVDFNDKVEKGQLIAQLDTTLLESAKRDAEASLERSRAELWKAEQDLERIKSLHAQGISADADFNTAEYNHRVAKASVDSAEAALARANQNLAYATITAPVSGIVVERDVDVGQTVAASLSAPKLFVIANDLSEMQILAPVDESDIGQIKEGQTANFTVKAYPDRKFSGVVKQVRLQSTVDQNIVEYTVVIGVKNTDGKLLPGMTATVEFITARVENILKVANAALRYRPSDAQMAEARARMQKQFEERMAASPNGHRGGEPGSTQNGAQQHAQGGPGGFPGGGSPGGGMNGGGNGQQGHTPSFMFYLDKAGQLSMMPVRPGITDGQFTEVRGPFLEDGMQVITGMSQGPAQASTANPFTGARPEQRRGPPGMF
jgi:HlyD family secretion protein